MKSELDSVRIKIGDQSDFPDWFSLRKALWPHCPDDKHQLEIEQILASDGIVAIAIQETNVIGFAEISLRHDHVEGVRQSPVPYLEGWYVSPQNRGIGVGRRLLKFVESWCQMQGYHELASDAEIENMLSVSLHKNLGFQEVGRTVHFVKLLY